MARGEIEADPRGGDRAAQLVGDRGEELLPRDCVKLVLTHLQIEILTVGDAVGDHHFEQELMRVGDGARVLPVRKVAQEMVETLEMERDDLIRPGARVHEDLAEQGRLVQRGFAPGLQIVGQRRGVAFEG